MCKRVGSLSESDLESECPTDITQQHQNHQQDLFLMDTTSSTLGSQPSSNEDNPRVKFLCSFSGSILPRPQDGKLRYVGGETRIVSVTRDVSYEELMVKMREIFEEAEVLKYQQPDEDLDALVSVVNDDDVTNMMEEYNKLGAGSGCTRLRIFVFSQSDQECSFADVDERDHERWYVDALNSHNESPEYRRQPSSDFHGVVSMEDVQLAEQYFNRMNLDGGLHNQRNFEVPMDQVNLRHLRVPHLGSVQAQQNVDLRRNDLEVPWSPGYYSPRQTDIHDSRLLTEFPTSPSSSRFHAPHSEFYDQRFGQVPEEYNAHQVNHMYEHPMQYADNLVLLPTGPVPSEKGGFPGNLHHCSNVYEGSSTYGNFRGSKRHQVFPSSPWNPEEQPHRESTTPNGYHRTPNIFTEGPPYRDMSLDNPESNVNYPYHSREQSNPRSMYNETHGHDGGWVLQPQSQPRAEELRHVCGAGRVTDPDHFVLDNVISARHANVVDRPNMTSHFPHHEDPRLVQRNQMFHDQAVATGTSIHIPPIDERMVRQPNPSSVYGADNLYQVHHPSQAIWRNIHSPMHGGLYDVSDSPQMANGLINPGIVRTTADSPRMQHGMEGSQKNLEIDVCALPEYSHGQPFMMPSSYPMQSHSHTPELSLAPSSPLLNNLVDPFLTRNENIVTDRLGDELVQKGDKDINQGAVTKGLKICNGTVPDQNIDLLDEPLSQTFRASAQGQVAKHSTGANPEENNRCTPPGESDILDDRLIFLPEFEGLVEEATLENVKAGTTILQEGDGSKIEHVSGAKSVQNEPAGKMMIWRLILIVIT